MNLKPIGEPDNFLLKLSPDVLPQPDAILTHRISPQKANAEGISEPEFLKHFMTKIVKPGTVFVGFNNIRFDDEFMRFTFWRNFYDAYEWQWKNNCSRWDILDLARITRALRPDGIEWPFAPDGKPTVALGALTSVNKLSHESAHDALGDVKALIEVAKLIKSKQPRLFDYLFELRDKSKVEALVNGNEPIIYTSGRYPSDYIKTTVAGIVGPTISQPGALMYDLRIDPEQFLNLSPAQLAKLWSLRGPDAPYFPVKVLRYNRAPAVATINALDNQSAKRLNIKLPDIDKNKTKVIANRDFAATLNKALEVMYPPRQPMMVSDVSTVDSQLYDGFINGPDKIKMSVVRAATGSTISDIALDFEDVRLNPLFGLYKARNFSSALSKEEAEAWAKFRKHNLEARADQFFKRIDEIKKTGAKTDLALLNDLNDYGSSLLAVK